MLFSQLESITHGRTTRLSQDLPVDILLIDSRKAIVAEGAVFFAIGGKHHDGHDFVRSLYDRGVRQFVLERPVEELGPHANIHLVTSAKSALQAIAAHHRSGIKAPIIGITGSNGKTIIKEWLYQLLSPDFKIAKNPASYNSQLGVPLSVWQIQPHHTLGIFEAGISTVNEMENLRKVLQPSLGIFTNIGSAHSEGFRDIGSKIKEKMILFAEAQRVIYCKDHHLIDEAINAAKIPSFSWGTKADADVRITKNDAGYLISTAGHEFTLTLPFSKSSQDIVFGIIGEK